MQRRPICLEDTTYHAEESHLSSHVAFVDLNKAYDKANHDLLLNLLECYGAPPWFASAIEHTYQYLVVELKIDREVVELPQLSASNEVTT